MQRSDTSTPPVRGASREQQADRPGHGLTSIQASLPPGFRHRSEDSWIEVSSQPSSSSLSSATEEIVTEGLRVQNDPARRRRRTRTTGSLQMSMDRRNHREASSSQDEYEESESESDRALTSSTEGLRPSLINPELRRYHTTTSMRSVETSEEEAQDEDDDDENSTAVNYPRNHSPNFTPQPNAFTHPPPLNRHHSASVPHHATRPTPVRSASQRHSYPAQQHAPYNMISPSYQADHDAALRASLSTLLSLGAAARGLPKSGQATSRAPAVASTRVDPSTIRMVPESVVLGSDSSDLPKTSATSSGPPSPLPVTSEKQKRKANTTSQPRSSSKERQRSLKKAKRVTSMEDISPTLFTWVLSAGVVVLFSAISFSAGYVVGKQDGRAEMLGQLGGAAGDAGRCGREAAGEMGRSSLGLKRLRWGGMSAAASGVRV